MTESTDQAGQGDQSASTDTWTDPNAQSAPSTPVATTNDTSSQDTTTEPPIPSGPQPGADEQVQGGDSGEVSTPSVPASPSGDFPVSGGAVNADNPPQELVTSPDAVETHPTEEDQPQTFAEGLVQNSPDPEELVDPSAPFNADNPPARAVVYDAAKSEAVVRHDALVAARDQAQTNVDNAQTLLDAAKADLEERDQELQDFEDNLDNGSSFEEQSTDQG